MDRVEVTVGGYRHMLKLEEEKWLYEKMFVFKKKADVGTGTHPCISAGRCSVAGRQHTALPLPSPRKNRVFAAPDCRAVPKEPHMPICNGRVHPL